MPTCTHCDALVAPSLTLTPVCTDCGGSAPLYCRPVYAEPATQACPQCKRPALLAGDTPGLCYSCIIKNANRQEVIAERIAQADSYLNDVSLPSYGELAEALRYLTQQAARGDQPLPTSNAALGRAREVLARLSEVTL